MLHRALLVLRQPQLRVIDNEPITEDERESIMTFYTEHQQRQTAAMQVGSEEREREREREREMREGGQREREREREREKEGKICVFCT